MFILFQIVSKALLTFTSASHYFKAANLFEISHGTALYLQPRLNSGDGTSPYAIPTTFVIVCSRAPERSRAINAAPS
jgi:hypothetical protein